MLKEELYNDFAKEEEVLTEEECWESDDLLNSAVDRTFDEIHLLMQDDEEEQVLSDDDDDAWWAAYQDEKIERRWAEETARWEQYKSTRERWGGVV
jgi:hypothetical protein